MSAETIQEKSLDMLSIVQIKMLVDQLEDLGIDPLHLHIDGRPRKFSVVVSGMVHDNEPVAA